MKPIHSEEKEQFRKLFDHEQIDRFEDRFNILDVFLKTEHHVTEPELFELLRQNGYNFDHSFVRETLKMMCRYGFAISRRFNNGIIRYEHRHLAQHHDHMICVKCGNILEFKNDQMEKLQVQIAGTHDFHMLQHRMEIYGICSECLKSRSREMTLAMAKPGELLVISELTGGPEVRMRLLTMGLRTGNKIEVINNNGKGEMVVSFDFHRYVIGRGLSQKILVRPADAE